ncbi:hypothetical protein [Streptomyces echinatus]|uniref:Uncharacterized protein (DUF433 family) n=1 Tax=Streptomyces echinatus TaxID=67293 RepID=A0A7W9UVD1_9ACTN|nr:hypothetical protein [Streptomyces echinatus]MBB5932327.1 uncharacterized protein (DUF433 family) [Streptomyces echinatus]
MPDKQKAVEEAARECLAHGGPDCLTNPRIPMEAIKRAFAAGANSDEIAAEMRRQRG